MEVMCQARQQRVADAKRRPAEKSGAGQQDDGGAGSQRDGRGSAYAWVIHWASVRVASTREAGFLGAHGPQRGLPWGKVLHAWMEFLRMSSLLNLRGAGGIERMPHPRAPWDMNETQTVLTGTRAWRWAGWAIQPRPCRGPT
jgi:hypothetical protein